MIEVSGLTKHYGTKVGVEDLSFTAGRGEILGLLGPNGAGKTTTIRLITGYMPPTRGWARVAGFDVEDHPAEVKRRIGYLPENPPLYRDMTVRSYLEFVAQIKEVPPARRRAQVDEALGALDLGPVAGRLIQNISRGYRQRVGLAQALLNRPEVLILDEPTAGLDPKQIIEIRRLIKSLGGRHTVVLSSHILPEVAQVCGRVVIINRGRLVAEDTPERLSQRLRRSQRLLVRVKGREDQVRACLEGLEGVLLVEEEGPAPGAAPDPEVSAFSLEAQPGFDLREPLFFALARAGLPILELRPVQLSLEEVFLQLTTEEPAEATAEGGEGA
ncbi:MAG: ABC transporter ATP-binding protein [Acetobacteraceae bacterium]|nr:ABC transporter ATP-binding protein [Acetobacteraceae bacterium]